ncbi:hypothetical protein CspeluHIS016_0107230 [Cutaneotrichosporon spelunceum]|uniref:Transcription factor TFIIIC triple barrel domain-containing protein n=1 Tax=Cutaneotrichosporon spelunceum TaxID=1672016 RepID=A0AAD3TP30_9TREE|nr:hypothetical protein CspeluHIS016_0107230 [Cutaneotrichosporon spelunceum]
MIPQQTAGLSDDAQVRRTLEHGRTLLGPGWRCVESFDDINDDVYEDDEEEEYVLMDLGTSVDTRTLQTEATYQLIGLDNPIPFLKIGENVFEGRISPLIGDEVVFDVVRQEDSQRPHYRPLLKTRQRIEFRGISLVERGTEREVPQPKSPKIAGALDRGMFPTRRRRIAEEDRVKEEDELKSKAKPNDAAPPRRSGRARGQIAPTVADLTADPGKGSSGPSIILTTSGPQQDESDNEEMVGDEEGEEGVVKSQRKGKGKEKALETEDVEMADDAAPVPEEAAEGEAGEIDATPTPVVRRRAGPGRPRGRRADPATPRMVRAAVAVSSLADLADIAYAGGLGPANIRLDVAPNADAELLAAVAAVRRGQPWTPGTKLTPAQEERLLRNLPASGPGSRGGRRGRGYGRGRGRGRPATRRRPLHSSGMGLGDDFFGVGSSNSASMDAEDEYDGEEEHADDDYWEGEDQDDLDGMEVDDEVV